MGLLDDAIARCEPRGRRTDTSYIGIVFEALEARPDLDDDRIRLEAMLLSPLKDWDHERLAIIINDIAAQIGIPVEVNKTNVGQWRNKRWPKVRTTDSPES